MADYMANGEMPTFVDAYLYNIARRQGKWLGGIEDMSDQAGLCDDAFYPTDLDYLFMQDNPSVMNAGESMREKMISMYDEQDLDAINELMNTAGVADRDRILIRRNVKMARRIDSLVNLRTMFVAIGAAHLPGDSGVIYLLT